MPHVITGVLKEYPWGVTDGLARWHGSTGTPQAELWFGAHPAGPSRVASGPDAGRSLADIDEHRGMPLVKLLCAGSPLSVQVHPDQALARRGWEAGSPLFSDDAEKAEVLVALRPFDVHAGWRDGASAAAVLEAAGAPDDVVMAASEGRAAEAVRLIVGLSPQVRADIESRVLDAARAVGWSEQSLDSLNRVLVAYPGDPGVIVTALLEHMTLEPGEALAVPAGVVHSYVSGLAVEVMTSSDNVLRLGLTSKPIAVDEALGAVRMDRRPELLCVSDREPIAPTGMPFDVAVVSGSRVLATGAHRVVIALEGDVVVSSESGADGRVREGSAMVWAPHENAASVESEGMMIVVTGSDADRGS